MLTLKSLTFQNIGRFVEPQTIDFSQLGSLCQIEGQNNVTSGSSGAGKSTIFKAINWLLGLDGPSTNILQSRLTKDSIQVGAVFDYDGHVLVIERGKKLSITLNGETITGSSKLTEEKLDQILGMSRELFSKIVHKKQGSNGFFLDLGASDTHKFLTSCLGLEKEQSKILVLDSRLSVLEKDEIRVTNEVFSNERALGAARESITILGPSPTLEITTEAILELETAYKLASEAYKLKKQVADVEMAELELQRPKIESQPFDRSLIVQTENEIGTLLAQVSALEKVEVERQAKVKSKISDLQLEISGLQSAEKDRQAAIQKKISKIQEESARLEKEEQNRQAIVKASISTLKIQLATEKGIIDKGAEAKGQAIILAKELPKIRSAICPFCERGDWVNDTCKAKEAEILAKLLDYKKVMVAGKEAENRVAEANEKLLALAVEAQPKVLLESDRVRSQELTQLRIDLQPQINPQIQVFIDQINQYRIDGQPQVVKEAVELKLQISFKVSGLAVLRQQESDHQFKESAKQQLIVVKFAEIQTQLRKTHEIALKHVQNQESQALANLQAAKYKVKAFEEAKARFEESLGKLRDQENAYAADLTSFTMDLYKIKEEIELATESKKAVKSYLSCSFEDALESIGDQATRLIRNIPNMGTTTIQFEGLKENKDGRVKEEVNCLISMDGEVGIPIKSLSGGERSAADIAIDLSVIQFIEERTGKGINIFLLDEFTNGLDTVCIENIFEMLKTFSLDRKLLIVEHNQIASQFLEDKLLVVRDGLTSKIVQ